MASADGGALGTLAPRPRSLRGFAVRARGRWALVRADASVQILVRVLLVAAAFACVAVAALLAPREDALKPAETARAARGASGRNGFKAPPVVALAQRRGEELPLDSDFSLEQAALTWSNRLIESARDEGATSAVLRFGPVSVQRSTVEHVVRAAKLTGSDPALLMAIADTESSFVPTAKASTSSASGLFQFVESTWLKAVRTFGWRHGREQEAKAIVGADDEPRVAGKKRAEILKLRNDPYLSAVLAAEMLKRDGERIAKQLGRPLTPGETYLIHFLGPEDAERFMEKMDEAPKTSAAQLLPKPARANKPIFFARQGRKMKDRSVGEVHQAFEAKIDQRSRRYRNVEQKLPGGAMAYTE